MYLILIAILLVGCGDSNDHVGEAQTPGGSGYQKGRDYNDVVKEFEDAGFKNVKTAKLDDLITGWLTKDGEVESVTVGSDEEYSPDEWVSEDIEVIITYHTFPEEEETVTESKEEETTEVIEEDSEDKTEEESTETTEETNKDINNENKEMILTAENNEDLATLLATKNEVDPFMSEFAQKYSGKIIQFDGYIANMMLHGDNKTRYNILIFAGNSNDTTFSGPNFQFEDVNIVHDLKLTGYNIPDTISEGQNLHIVAEVLEYNEVTGLFLLKPISTEIR